MTPAERFEHMVAMAMQAFDSLWTGHTWSGSPIHPARDEFERAVRERLAQSAQVYELEIGASERSR